MVTSGHRWKEEPPCLFILSQPFLAPREFPLVWQMSNFCLIGALVCRLGPVIGSFVAARTNWRFSFVVLTAFSGFLCVLVAFACPETYPPVILSRIAKELREETGDQRILSRLEYSEICTRERSRSERLKAEFVRLFGMPFIMLFTESIVAMITLFSES